MTLQIIVLPPLRNKRKVSPLAPKLPAEVLTYITSLMFEFRKKRTPRYDYHVLHATSKTSTISPFFSDTPRVGNPDHPPQKWWILRRILFRPRQEKCLQRSFLHHLHVPLQGGGKLQTQGLAPMGFSDMDGVPVLPPPNFNKFMPKMTPYLKDF